MVDRVIPRVSVDWALDGSFSGPYDTITTDVASDPGLAVEQGMDVSQALRPPMVNAADWEVFNHTGKYSQENGASPLYQLIAPGKPVQVLGAWGSRDLYRAHTAYREPDAYRGLVPYALATGVIGSLTMTTELGNRRVSFSTVGSLSRLRGVTLSVPIQANIRTDQALTLILDAVGWPAGKRALTPGDTTMSYWWLDERDAYDACVELLATEGPGQFYEDGDGVLHFESRSYRSVTARSQTTQAIYFDTAGGAPDSYRTHNAYRWRDPYRGRSGGLWFTQLAYEPGYKNIVNDAKYTARRRTLNTLGPIWEYGQTLTLGAGQSTTLIARPTDPFLNAVTPAEGTDYTVTPAAGATVTLQYQSGAVAFIGVTDAGSGCTVTGASGSNGLRLRGQSLTVSSESVVASTVDTTSSRARFGRRTLDVGGWPELSPAAAEAVCNAHVSRRQTQRPQVTITVRDVNNAHIEQVLRRSVSDRVTIVDGSSGLHADCWVESKGVTIGSGCALTGVLTCEKVAEIGGALWDATTSKWDLSVWAD
jgi:hypothetical protein